jgi:hypothetical protein
MAYDKVVDSSVLDAGLKQIADAIREKGGTSDNLAFPAAMAEAIAAIEAGGGNIAFGTVTAATTSAAITVTHDLGAIPTIGVFIRTDGGDLTSTSDMFALYQDANCTHRIYPYNSKLNATFGAAQTFTSTIQSYYFNKATTTTACTPKYLTAGHTYFWALFA